MKRVQLIQSTVGRVQDSGQVTPRRLLLGYHVQVDPCAKVRVIPFGFTLRERMEYTEQEANILK
jgi:hypothetical protein